MRDLGNQGDIDGRDQLGAKSVPVGRGLPPAAECGLIRQSHPTFSSGPAAILHLLIVMPGGTRTRTEVALLRILSRGHRRPMVVTLDSHEWEQHRGLARVGVIGVFAQFYPQEALFPPCFSVKRESYYRGARQRE